MTISEAIKVLESEVACWYLHPEEIYPRAFRLGIEALKRIQHDRKEVGSEHYIRLPGETEE